MSGEKNIVCLLWGCDVCANAKLTKFSSRCKYGDRGSECPPASLLESPAFAPQAWIKSSVTFTVTKIHSLFIFNPTHAPLTLTRSAVTDKKQTNKKKKCMAVLGRTEVDGRHPDFLPMWLQMYFSKKQTKTYQWAVNGWNDFYDFLWPIKCLCCNCRQAKVREVRKVIDYTFHDSIMVVCLGDPWSLHFP